MSQAYPKRGTLKKCLEHYRSEVGETQAIQELMEFTGVQEPTALGWVRGNRVPVGFNLIQLWYFLDSKGYKLKEVESLQPEVADLGRLIAHRVVIAEYLCDVLGYAHGRSIHQLWHVLQGHRQMVTKKLEFAQIVIEDHQDKLREVKLSSTTATPRPAASPQPVEETAPRSVGKPARTAGADALVPIAVALISGLRPIVMQLADGDSELHERVREEVGPDNFFDTLDALKQMSGRYAKRFIQEH